MRIYIKIYLQTSLYYTRSFYLFALIDSINEETMNDILLVFSLLTHTIENEGEKTRS